MTENPPSNLVMTGFYTFTPAIFPACHFVQPSNRGEYEISEVIDSLIQSGRTIAAIRMDGWRVDVGIPTTATEPDDYCATENRIPRPPKLLLIEWRPF